MNVLIRDSRGEIHTNREESHVKTEAETGVMQLQAK